VKRTSSGTDRRRGQTLEQIGEEDKHWNRPEKKTSTGTDRRRGQVVEQTGEEDK
jgi:hypothetical protein